MRIAKNHPLPDGNKRLAWMAMVLFLDLNNVQLAVSDDDVVGMVLSVAAGEMDERALTDWLVARITD